MSKYKILLTDTVFADVEIEQKILKSIDAELVLYKGKTEDELIKAGKDCDAVLNTFILIPRKVLESWPKCKVIVRYGVGVNTIDIKAASDNNIMVANVPDFCLDEVADHAMALMFTILRKTAFYSNAIKKGKWDYKIGVPISRIKGLNFCLLGFGHIAQNVAKRCKPFGFNIYAYDPYVKASVFEEMNATKVETIEELVKIADVLSMHLPLNNETNGIINLELMKKMKNTSIIINTSRGPLIKQNDLITALKNKIIGFAGLDVLEFEPPSEDCELLKMENVILTPHAGFYSEESGVQLRNSTAMEAVYTLIEGNPHAWVNKKSLQENK